MKSCASGRKKQGKKQLLGNKRFHTVLESVNRSYRTWGCSAGSLLCPFKRLSVMFFADMK